ncbi:anhydro-N-acetylmuramic acid kinase, partial [Striga asiatica]
TLSKNEPSGPTCCSTYCRTWKSSSVCSESTRNTASYPHRPLRSDSNSEWDATGRQGNHFGGKWVTEVPSLDVVGGSISQGDVEGDLLVFGTLALIIVLNLRPYRVNELKIKPLQDFAAMLSAAAPRLHKTMAIGFEFFPMAPHKTLSYPHRPLRSDSNSEWDATGRQGNHFGGKWVTEVPSLDVVVLGVGFGGWDTGTRGSIRQCAVIILHEKRESNERGRGEPLWSTNPYTALHINRIEAGRKTLISVIEDASIIIIIVNMMATIAPHRGFCVVNRIGLQLREVGSWEPKPIIRANEKGQPIQRAVHVNQGATLRVVPVNIETKCGVRRIRVDPYLWPIILILGVVAIGPNPVLGKPSHMKKLARWLGNSKQWGSWCYQKTKEAWESSLENEDLTLKRLDEILNNVEARFIVFRQIKAEDWAVVVVEEKAVNAIRQSSSRFSAD